MMHGSIIDSYNAALDFALDSLNAEDGRVFLGLWREGAWLEIANDFSEFDLASTGQCDSTGALLTRQ